MKMRKGFLIYEEMRKCFPIYEEAVSHIWLCNCSTLNFLMCEENFLFFFISVKSWTGSTFFPGGILNLVFRNFLFLFFVHSDIFVIKLLFSSKYQYNLSCPLSPGWVFWFQISLSPCYACTMPSEPRLSKTLGVLNEDGVYSWLEIRFNKNHAWPS